MGMLFLYVVIDIMAYGCLGGSPNGTKDLGSFYVSINSQNSDEQY